MAGSWSRGGHRPRPEVCLWQPQAGGNTRWQGRVSPMVCSSLGAFGLELSKRCCLTKTQTKTRCIKSCCALATVTCGFMYVCLRFVFVAQCPCAVLAQALASLSDLPPAFLCHTHPPKTARRCLWLIEIHEAVARCRVKVWWNQSGGLAPGLVKAAGGLAYEPLSLLG